MTAVVVAIMILVSKRRRKNLSTTGSSIYSGPYTNTAYSHSSMSRRSWTEQPKDFYSKQFWDLFLPLVIFSVRLGQENSTTVSWETSYPLLSSPVVVIQWPVLSPLRISVQSPSLTRQDLSILSSIYCQCWVQRSVRPATSPAEFCILVSVNQFNSTNKMWF